MDLTRNEFLRLLAGTGIGTLGLSTLGACDDNSDGKDRIDAPAGAVDAPKPVDAAIDAAIDAPTTTGNCSQNGTIVSTNLHSHTMVMAISKDDVIAGNTKTYTMGGGHTHTVTVTQQMFTMLQNNMITTAQSNSDQTGHTHIVTIRCA